MKTSWLVGIILHLLFIFQFGRVLSNIPDHIQPINIPELEEQYLNSQYVNPNSQTWIDDPELYTYAGSKYLQGTDPSNLNFEMQPLTKYFFGISTLVFGTPIAFQLISGGLLLFFLYISSLQFLPPYLAILPSLFLIYDHLFINQLSHAYLDLFQTTLITLSLLLLIRSRAVSRYVYFTLICLGLVALSKTFSVAILLYIAMMIFIFFFTPKHIRRLLFFSWVPITIYLIGYSIFFLYHPNLVDFFKLHLNILRLYRSYVPEYPLGEIYRIIFRGQWRMWYGDYGLRPAEFWSILWPSSIATTFGFLLFQMSQVFSPFPGLRSLPQTIRSKLADIHPLILIHSVWFAIYLIFISFRLVFPRYLMPLLPSSYLISAFVIKTFLNRYSSDATSAASSNIIK